MVFFQVPASSPQISHTWHEPGLFLTRGLSGIYKYKEAIIMSFVSLTRDNKYHKKEINKQIATLIHGYIPYHFASTSLATICQQIVI